MATPDDVKDGVAVGDVRLWVQDGVIDPLQILTSVNSDWTFQHGCQEVHYITCKIRLSFSLHPPITPHPSILPVYHPLEWAWPPNEITAG